MGKFQAQANLTIKLSKDKQTKVNYVNSFLHKEGLETEEKKTKVALSSQVKTTYH